MFYLRNFKNFAAAELDLDQSATLLVGPNGSGKSNLIEAVELLSFLAAGHRLHEVTDIGREGGIEVRGGLEACARIGFNEFTLGLQTSIVPPASTVPASVKYEISVRVRPEPRVVGEHLRVEGRNIPVFKILPPEPDSPSADNRVRYDNNARGGKKPVESIAADRSALFQYSRFASREKGFLEALMLINDVSRRLETPNVSGRGASGARLVRLDQLPGYIEFVESGRLGDLVTRRVYEQHLRPNYEEARQADIDQWVNSLP